MCFVSRVLHDEKTRLVERSGGWRNSVILRKIHEYGGQTINERASQLMPFLDTNCRLYTDRMKGPRPPIPSWMGFPIEETDQFGFQDPPSLSRLGGLYATVTDVLEEGGFRNPQVLARFLSSQDSIFVQVSQSSSPRLEEYYEDQFCIFYANHLTIKNNSIFNKL